VAKIVVKLRNLNTFLKGKLLNEKLKVEIANSAKAVIMIDTDEEQESSEDSGSREGEKQEQRSNSLAESVEQASIHHIVKKFTKSQ
jgi:hypothetical protein